MRRFPLLGLSTKQTIMQRQGDDAARHQLGEDSYQYPRLHVHQAVTQVASKNLPKRRVLCQDRRAKPLGVLPSGWQKALTLCRLRVRIGPRLGIIADADAISPAGHFWRSRLLSNMKTLNASLTPLR